MMDLIFNQPFGSLLGWLIHFCGNYGLALIVFTFIVKIILLPLGVLQQKSTIKQIGLRPKEALIRKKFAGDKEKLNTAIAQLYSEEKVNPAAGCLPLLVQLPILLGLYKIIRAPLTYVLKFSADAIQQLDSAHLSNGFIQETIINAAKLDYAAEVKLAEGLFNHFDVLVSQGVVSANLIPINYNFLGMNLSMTPTLALNMLLLIPILAGATAFLQTLYQMKTQPVAGGAEGSTKMMMYTMPLLSVWITFTMPAGIGLYWSISNVASILQTMLFNAIWSPKKALAEAELKLAEEEKIKKVNKKKNIPEPVKEDPKLNKYISKTRIPNPIDDEL